LKEKGGRGLEVVFSVGVRGRERVRRVNEER
jgi:hypothetical protein